MVSDDLPTPPDGLRIAGYAPCAEGAVILLAPDEPSFWTIFCRSTEFLDGQPDPMDRWSRRVVTQWAAGWAAKAVFPSDGPPYASFLDWARASGTCWASPVGMLVHHEMGLFISFRAAIILEHPLPAPPQSTSPCISCHAPCLTACPADAFQGSYDASRCHDFLDSPAGDECMNAGCRVRRACPIGKGCGRLPEQSAWHMRQFHR
ncbi:ferredoxin [Paracoccus sp. Z330]|uniref:Ferredoxin n=1 Tax=Paracoccus onchidii TaxID=3017813 RepID=A0ABT4Z9F7_9RHOB|nr:ferredoxin [Paracoccus onchidii]MDB6175978.1 ferredoxin [Paracoccus onchidii]